MKESNIRDIYYAEQHHADLWWWQDYDKYDLNKYRDELWQELVSNGSINIDNCVQQWTPESWKSSVQLTKQELEIIIFHQIKQIYWSYSSKAEDFIKLAA